MSVTGDFSEAKNDIIEEYKEYEKHPKIWRRLVTHFLLFALWALTMFCVLWVLNKAWDYYVKVRSIVEHPVKNNEDNRWKWLSWLNERFENYCERVVMGMSKYEIKLEDKYL